MLHDSFTLIDEDMTKIKEFEALERFEGPMTRVMTRRDMEVLRELFATLIKIEPSLEK